MQSDELKWGGLKEMRESNIHFKLDLGLERLLMAMSKKSRCFPLSYPDPDGAEIITFRNPKRQRQQAARNIMVS